MSVTIEQAGQTAHAYQCRVNAIRGHRHGDVMPYARRAFRVLQARSKRRPYVRSSYFKGDKVFFDFFWSHVLSKRPGDQARRLRFLPCALELLRKTNNHPITVVDTTDKDVLLHRFVGLTPDGSVFYVQVREDRRDNRKQCISIFPGK